ncbi:sensor histidine kinase KdpD [Acidisphaera sp. S103]|uniref:sensor histidine kinase n=1 Tax=Acidisphaera sp. S103 TaxID=1747223 RepID=UPI00131D4349|nr:HAMP domain-containing sensor histidine kinase [Acidisphaera sp. S103]
MAAFIRANIASISAEWERFAGTLLPEEAFSSSVLRNGIVELLADIAENMEHEQSAAEQRAKSEGEPNRSHYSEGAIALHVVSRVAMGVSARQFISEFRALRATVIRLWQRDSSEIDSSSLNDMIRFNEAIDQMLSEGVVNYSQEIDRSRELFLGILGHDLRNPLSAITGLAELQLRVKTPERHAQFSSQILVSARRMSHMISDLLELARVRLGSGIIIHRTPTSLRRICNTVVAEMQAVFPNRVVQTNGDDELPGEWDEHRLSQVISNLVSNAVQHGAVNSAVTLTAKRSGDGAEVSVHNEGIPIPPDMIPKLFDSFYRLDEDVGSHANGLGLGLYISKEIIAAHGGTIEVRSSAEEGTTFIVRLPKA